MASDDFNGSPDYGDPPPGGQLSHDAKTWAMLCHVAAFAGYVVPFGNIIAPLIVWLLKRDEDPFIDDQGKESLNFQITMTIAIAISIPLVFVVIGYFLLIALPIINLVLIIIAAIKANGGEPYRYPFALRLVT